MLHNVSTRISRPLAGLTSQCGLQLDIGSINPYPIGHRLYKPMPGPTRFSQKICILVHRPCVPTASPKPKPARHTIWRRTKSWVWWPRVKFTGNMSFFCANSGFKPCFVFVETSSDDELGSPDMFGDWEGTVVLSVCLRCFLYDAKRFHEDGACSCVSVVYLLTSYQVIINSTVDLSIHVYPDGSRFGFRLLLSSFFAQRFFKKCLCLWMRMFRANLSEALPKKRKNIWTGLKLWNHSMQSTYVKYLACLTSDADPIVATILPL